MKEIEYVPKKDGLNFSEILKKVIIAIVVIAIFIILIATGQIVFILQIFGWIENRVREITGLDVLLVKGITAILMALLLILPVGKLIFAFFPLPQKNKKIKIFAVFAIFALLFFATYLSSMNVYFNPNTGEPLKYYTTTADGEYTFYSSGGYDPVTGDKLQPVNKDVVLKHLKSKREEDPKRTEKIITMIAVTILLGFLIFALFNLIRAFKEFIGMFKPANSPFRNFKRRLDEIKKEKK